MTRTSLLGLRSKRAVSHRPDANVQIVTIPASRTELEAHIWAVNSAFEAGQDDLALELAARYLTA